MQTHPATRLDANMERAMHAVGVLAAVMVLVGFYAIAIHILWSIVPFGKVIVGLSTATLAYLVLVGLVMGRRS